LTLVNNGIWRSIIRRDLLLKLKRAVKHWNRLLRDVVEAPSLETFKARLDGALSNLVWLKLSLLTAGGLG